MIRKNNTISNENILLPCKQSLVLCIGNYWIMFLQHFLQNELFVLVGLFKIFHKIVSKSLGRRGNNIYSCVHFYELGPSHDF